MTAGAGPRLALLSTVVSVPAAFNPLLDELLPEVDRWHIVDESLLADAIRAGSLPPATADRVVAQVRLAVDAGADAVLVTCSSIGAAAETSDAVVPVPVRRIDAPMAMEAVERGRRIGVLATLRSTLEPTADLIRRMGVVRRREVDVEAAVADGAFDALRRGDRAEHDRLVARAAADLAARRDVLVLAQASMAPAIETLLDLGVPVLTSPRSGVAQMRRVLGLTPLRT